MRVDLLTTPVLQSPCSKDALPLMLTIQPSRGVTGRFDRPIDAASLLALLRAATELSARTLKRFDLQIHSLTTATLLAVDLPDSALEHLGFFID